MAACWLNQDQPRNKTRPWFAMARRGNKNIPRTVLKSTATKIVIRPMNWNQYRVGTLLQRVHTDCLGRKFSPQRSQYTAALPWAGMQTRDRRQLTAFVVPKTTGQRGSFGLGVFSCNKSLTCSIPAKYAIKSRCTEPSPSYSTEPGRRRANFAALILQFVQLLLQIGFVLLQLLQLGVPVLDVGNVVLHSRGDVKAAVPQLFDLVFFRLNSLFCGGDPVEQAASLAAPVFLVLARHGYDARFRLSICLSRCCCARGRRLVIPHNRHAIAAQACQIFFGVHLLWFGFFFFRLFRRVCRGFIFLRRLRLRLGWGLFRGLGS